MVGKVSKFDPDFLRAKAAMLGNGDYKYGCLRCGWVGFSPWISYTSETDERGAKHDIQQYKCPGCKRINYWYRFTLAEMNHDRT